MTTEIKKPEILKSVNIAKAIRLLPEPKNFTPDTVTVVVEKLKYTFSKQEGVWYFDSKTTNKNYKK